MSDRVVRVILRGEVGGYIASMGRAGAATEASMARASKATTLHGKALGALGALGKGAGIGVAGGLALAVKEAADFNEKMALVQTLSHANAAQMRDLRKAAMSAGTGFGYTAKEVADGQAEMIKAGVSLKDIMGGGLRGTLALAAAGQTDVATATTIAASAMTQFNLKGKDIPHLADLLAAGADKALGSVEDLGYGLSQVGTTAHQMGISVEDTTGTLAEFAQAGLIGEKGGTTFKQMLLQLAAPTNKAKDLMDEYHLSLYKTNGQLKSMPEIAGNIQRSFEHATPAQRNYALGVIFGSRAIQGANILMKDGEKGNRKWIASVNDQGFAAQQASGKLDSLKGDLQKLKAAGENAFIGLGQGAQSPLRHFVQDATGELNKLTRDHSIERWSKRIGDDLGTVLREAKPVARDIGHALQTVGAGVKDVADGFDRLPKGLQQALVTGAVVGVGAHKLGLDSLLLGGLKGGVKAATGGGGPLGVQKVFVVNMGAGGLGGAGGPGAGGKPTTLAGRAANLGGRLFGAGATIAVGSLVVSSVTSPSHKALAGAGTGAAAGAQLLGVPGAVAGGVIGGVVGLDSAKDPTNTAYLKSMSARRKNVADLIGVYKALQKQQHELNADPKGWVPPAALIAGDKMKNTLTEIGKATGLSGQKLKDFVNGVQRLDSSMHPVHSAALNFEQLRFAAEKAGISGNELHHMLGTLPKSVQTKIETPGALKSKADVRDLGKQFGLTPKQIKTIMTLVGVEKAQGDVKNTRQGLKTLNTTSSKPKVLLDDQASKLISGVDKKLLDLGRQKPTPVATLQDLATRRVNVVHKELNDLGAQRPTPVAHLTDLATSKVKTVHKELSDLNGMRPTPVAGFDSGRARAGIRSYVAYVNQQLHGGIRDEAVKITLSAQAQRVHSEIAALNRAEGGPVWGAGSETSDSIDAKLSNNEHVLAAAEVRAFGKGDVRRGHKVVELWRQAALHGALPDPNDLPKFAAGGPVLRVDTARTGSITANAQAYFNSITAEVSKALSKSAEQAFAMGGNGQPLGPNGTLSLGQIVAGQRFAKAQNGKPYIWGGVGPRGYDCSGYQSAILNAAHGRNPYSRIGSTGSMPWPGSRPGVGRYTIGWFKGSPGHTSGNIGGLGVESTGNHVRIGRAARSPMNGMFSGHMHYAKGGAVEVPRILRTDEYVMSGDAVRQHGVDLFDALNAPRLHKGGPVGFAKGGPALQKALHRFLATSAAPDYLRHAARVGGDALHKALLQLMKGHSAPDYLREAFTGHGGGGASTGHGHETPAQKRRDAARKKREAEKTAAQKRRDAAREKALKHHLALINKAASKIAGELSKVSDKLKATRGARNELAGTVSQAFVSDPFSGTLGGFDSQMRYESTRLRGANTDLAKLHKAGIGPGLLSQLASSGNATLIHQFAQLSRGDLAKRQAAFDARNRLDRQAGALVGDAVYGKQIATLTHEVQHLTHELHVLRTSGKHIGNQITHIHGAKARDTEQLAKKLHKKQQQAARLARHR